MDLVIVVVKIDFEKGVKGIFLIVVEIEEGEGF